MCAIDKYSSSKRFGQVSGNILQHLNSSGQKHDLVIRERISRFREIQGRLPIENTTVS